MHTIIRQNQFETNSSSSHAIAVDPFFESYSSIIPDANNNITLFTEYYGSRRARYSHPINKANYVLSHFIHEIRDFDNDVEIISQSGIYKAMQEMIQEHTNANVIIQNHRGGTDNSIPELNRLFYSGFHSEYLKPINEVKAMLKEIVFGPKVILTGEDYESDEAINRRIHTPSIDVSLYDQDGRLFTVLEIPKTEFDPTVDGVIKYLESSDFDEETLAENHMILTLGKNITHTHYVVYSSVKLKLIKDTLIDVSYSYNSHAVEDAPNLNVVFTLFPRW